MTAATTTAPVQLQPHPPLRRAEYIHVTDLTNVYNIDHIRMEEELTRVRYEKENPTTSTAATILLKRQQILEQRQEQETSDGKRTDEFNTTKVARDLTTKENSEQPVVENEIHHQPVPITELDTSYPKKRLQPPRGGQNLVVYV